MRSKEEAKRFPEPVENLLNKVGGGEGRMYRQQSLRASAKYKLSQSQAVQKQKHNNPKLSNAL